MPIKNFMINSQKSGKTIDLTIQIDEKNEAKFNISLERAEELAKALIVAVRHSRMPSQKVPATSPIKKKLLKTVH